MSAIVCKSGSPEAFPDPAGAPSSSAGGAASALLQFSAFELLRAPLMAEGIGLQLKRAPCWVLRECALSPPPSLLQSLLLSCCLRSYCPKALACGMSVRPAVTVACMACCPLM